MTFQPFFNHRKTMKEQQHLFLQLLGHLPARLTAQQAAWVINCQLHDIAPLVSAKLLKPLGNPKPNSVKYFATADLLEVSKDHRWLSRVTAVIGQRGQRKTEAKSFPVVNKNS